MSRKYRGGKQSNLEELSLYDVFNQIRITGDGNCLFRAILYGLCKNDSEYSDLRQTVCDYISAHREDFDAFIDDEYETFDEYLEIMRTNGEWGGNLEIIAASQILQFNFIVYRSQSLDIIYEHFYTSDFITIHLEFFLGDHYNFLEPKSQIKSRKKTSENSRNKSDRVYESYQEKIDENDSSYFNNDEMLESYMNADYENDDIYTSSDSDNNIEDCENDIDNAESQTQNKSMDIERSFSSEDSAVGWQRLEDSEEIEDFNFSDSFDHSFDHSFDLTSNHHYFERKSTYLDLFLTEELLELIVDYTNRRAQTHYQSHKKKRRSHTIKWNNLTIVELKAFLSILSHMGLMRAANLDFYWSNDKTFRYPGIADIMSRDRFKSINKFIYYTDPDPYTLSQNTKDPFMKFRTLFDAVNDSCQDHWNRTDKLTIDESMIEFFGRHSGKVFMPNKPVKNGFKVYVLADYRGYVLKFIPSFWFKDDEKNANRPKKTNKTKEIVLSLVDGYEGRGLHIFMDR